MFIYLISILLQLGHIVSDFLSAGYIFISNVILFLEVKNFSFNINANDNNNLENFVIEINPEIFNDFSGSTSNST